MAKEEKKRTFESEALILPALKMILVEPSDPMVNRVRRNIVAKKTNKLDEDMIMRIIGKLSLKD